jgi:hypothetical protein
LRIFYCVCFQNHVVMVIIRTRCSVFPVNCRGWEAWWMSQCLQIQDTVIHGCRSWIRCTPSGMLPRWKLLYYCDLGWSQPPVSSIALPPPAPQLHSRASQKSVTVIWCVVQPSSAVCFKLFYSLNVAVCWNTMLLIFADLRYMYRQGRSQRIYRYFGGMHYLYALRVPVACNECSAPCVMPENTERISINSST